MQSSLENSSSAETSEIKIEQFAELVQSRTPLRLLVRWVAGIRASVHTKLLAAFLIVTAAFIAMALVSLQTIVNATQQSQLLDEAHELVSLAQQGEHALARQMHFTDLALLSQDEVAISKILRENNRFNDRLAKVEAAGPAEQALVEQIRSTQDEAMAVVADMANAIRDGKLGSVTGALLQRQERLDERDHHAGRAAGRGAAGPDGAAARQRRGDQSPLADPYCCVRGERGHLRASLRVRHLLVVHSSGARSAGLSRARSPRASSAAASGSPIATSSGRSPNG